MNRHDDNDVAEDNGLMGVDPGVAMSGDFPDDIAMDYVAFDLAFHPECDVLCTGNIEGNIDCYKYSNDENELVSSINVHESAVRAIGYSADGTHLFTGSSDQSMCVIDQETQTVVRKQPNAHDGAIYSMAIRDNLIATGDDDGIIKLWDTRQQAAAHQFEEHEDYVSQMLFVPESNKLIAVGACGYLACLDIRKGKLIARSDNMDQALTSVALVRHGERCVVGTEEGTLEMWRTGDWGNIETRATTLHGGTNSIGAMLTVDDERILTAAEDGVVRLLSIEPTALISAINEHADSDIEQMRLSRDRRLLATIGDDMQLKFADVAFLFDGSAKPQASGTKANAETRKFFKGFK